MASFDKDYVDQNYKDLPAFAAADGCSAIYAYAQVPGGPKTNYYTIRRPADERAMRSSGSIHDPVQVWPRP
jgi:hypothetical protein